jgi:hypothetical protein
MARTTKPKGPECPHCGVTHRTVTPEQCEDRHMSEHTLQARILSRATRRGWRVAHAGRGWVGNMETGVGQFVTPMAKGWPDLMLLKPGVVYPILVMELKREDGAPDEAQVEWLRLFNDCGVPAMVVRPSDLREGRVNVLLTQTP